MCRKREFDEVIIEHVALEPFLVRLTIGHSLDVFVPRLRKSRNKRIIIVPRLSASSQVHNGHG